MSQPPEIDSLLHKMGSLKEESSALQYIFFVLGGLAGILNVVLRIIMELAWSCIKSTHKGVKMDPSSHPKLSMVRAVHYLFR